MDLCLKWLTVDHFLTAIASYCYLSYPCVAWAGWFGQKKKITQLKINIYQCVATNQTHKNSREHNSKFPYTYDIVTPFSTSQISTRFHYLEIYSKPISVLNTIHVTYSFQSSLFYYPWCKHFLLFGKVNIAARTTLFMLGTQN